MSPRGPSPSRSSTSMLTAERSRSVDSTTVGGSAGGTEAPTSPVLAPWGSRPNTLAGGDADDGANLVDARRGDDQGGMPCIAAGRLLEAGDVVDARHERRAVTSPKARRDGRCHVHGSSGKPGRRDSGGKSCGRNFADVISHPTQDRASRSPPTTYMLGHRPGATGEDTAMTIVERPDTTGHRDRPHRGARRDPVGPGQHDAGAQARRQRSNRSTSTRSCAPWAAPPAGSTAST